MTRTSTLKRQHDAIVLLAGDIGAAADTIDTPIDAERLSRLLTRLDTILKTHLASEDKLLYPSTIASGDGPTAETASRFSHEMGSLLDAYLALPGAGRTGPRFLQAKTASAANGALCSPR